MSDFVDFDAFRAERDVPPLRFKLGGVVWELPGALPAGAVLQVAAINAQLTDENGDIGIDNLKLSPDLMALVARAAFPGDLVDRLVAVGMSAEEMADVIAWAMGEWQARAAESREPDPGEAAAQTDQDGSSGPNGFSPTGGPSSPTSPASTGSTTPATG